VPRSPLIRHTLTTTIAPKTFVSECHGRGGFIRNPVVTRQTFPGFGGAGGAPFAGQTPAPPPKAVGGVGSGFGAMPAGFYPAAPVATARQAAANPWAGFNWAAFFGGHQ
jgi:hypothetical protein